MTTQCTEGKLVFHDLAWMRAVASVDLTAASSSRMRALACDSDDVMGERIGKSYRIRNKSVLDPNGPLVLPWRPRCETDALY